MKTKSLFLVFSLCALIHISPAEIEQSKDGTQSGATKEFKTKIVIDKDGGMGGGGHGGNRGRRHVDGDWGGGGGYGDGWEGGEYEGCCEGEGKERNDEGWGEVGGTEAGLGGENEGGINGKAGEGA